MGSSNAMTLVKAAVLLFLVGVSTTTVVDARLDQNSIITQMLMSDDKNMYYLQKSKPPSESCCDLCACTKSMHPKCVCLDVPEYCPSGCKDCICTMSNPPQCHCFDITDSCLRACA